MSDSYTETTSTSWLSRLGESFKSVLAGGLMFLVAFPVLFLNEGCSARAQRLIASGREHVTAAEAETIDPALDGELIHVSGEATTADTLTDDEFAITVDALRLERSVEIYQWVEHKETEKVKKTGGSETTKTTWNYQREWVDDPVDSDRFHIEDRRYQNPDEMAYDDQHWTATTVSLGARQLTEDLLLQISNREELLVTGEHLAQLSPALQDELQVYEGWFYLSEDPARPQVGDLRIGFDVVWPQDVSILAAQRGESFAAWSPPGGSGKINRLETGRYSAEDMFDHWSSSNSTFTWLLRFGGFLLMASGLAMVFQPLVTAADVLPFLGDLLGWGVGLFAGVVAASLSVSTIAVAWLFYRPLFGLALLAAAGVAVFLLYRMGHKRRASIALREIAPEPDPDPA